MATRRTEAEVQAIVDRCVETDEQWMALAEELPEVIKRFQEGV